MEKKKCRQKKKQPNRLLIFHGLTIYGAFSTSNLLLSYTRRESDERQREWEKQQRRVRTIYETNFRRLNIELRILGMFFSSSSFTVIGGRSGVPKWHIHFIQLSKYVHFFILFRFQNVTHKTRLLRFYVHFIL